MTGYKPSDPSTDRGAVELDVLRYWRKTGVGGYKIDAFVALEPKNHLHVQAAVDLFGGSYIGLALPVSAQQQKVWSVPPGGPTGTGAPGSWGGHAVVVEAYDAHGLTDHHLGPEEEDDLVVLGHLLRRVLRLPLRAVGGQETGAVGVQPGRAPGRPQSVGRLSAGATVRSQAAVSMRPFSLDLNEQPVVAGAREDDRETDARRERHSQVVGVVDHARPLDQRQRRHRHRAGRVDVREHREVARHDHRVPAIPMYG